MKVILAFFLSLLALGVLAQTEVVDASQMNEKKFRELVTSYPNSESDTVFYRDFSRRLNASFLTVFGKRPAKGFSTVVLVCMNKTGVIDRIVLLEQGKFSEDSVEVASLKAKQRTALTAAADGLKAVPRKSNASMNLYHYFGMPRREKHAGDSILTELSQLCEFRDSMKIKSIYLDHLELQRVPETIYRFPNLEYLFVNANFITSLSINCQKLPKLKQLHANQNRLTADSLHFTKNKSLEILNINQNRFADVPDAVRNCVKLKSLWMADNNLEKLSGKGMKAARHVRDLNLYQTRLTTVPGELKKFRKLEILDLYHNNLTELPRQVVRLRKLTHLAVSHNQIKRLPEKLSRLKRLEVLYAHHNWLSSLPKNFDKLQNIQILDLGYNWFTNFPTDIVALQKLRELDLSSNNFATFPEQTLGMARLEKLYLRGNPFLKGTDAETNISKQLSLLKVRNVEVFY